MIASHCRHVIFSRTIWITFQLRRHALQHLGDVLAELAQLAAAARACRRRWLDAALARQVLRQWTSRGLASRGRRCRTLLTLRRLRRCDLVGGCVLGNLLDQFAEL